MARTFIRQDAQIRQSLTFDDAVTAGSTMESGSTSIESDLNAIRSQAKRFIWADSSGNWYDDIQTVNSKKRGIKDLNVDLNDIEVKPLLFRGQILTDVTVPTAQNWVLLSVSGSEAPTQTAAVGSGTAEGAVVAVLGDGDIDSHQLNEVSGADAISPKNLCLIRDASTGSIIQDTDGKDVYALIQAQYGTVDGDTFDDSTKKVQLSFVKENTGGTDLVAATVGCIATKVVNYSYVRRIQLDNVPEAAFLSGVFTDQSSAGSDVTLDKAVDNQVGAVTQTDRNIEWRITDTYAVTFETSDGGRTLLGIEPASGGDVIEMNLDTLDINNVNSVDFLNGIVVDSGGTAITIGASAGILSSAGALGISSGGSADLTLTAAGETIFVDGNKAGSSYSGSLKLSDTSAEWSAFETAYGEVSLLNAITQGRMKKYVAAVTENISADTNVTGAGGSPNIDAQLGDYSGVTFLTQVNVFVNGTLMRNGADASANHDVYPGTTPANGDLKFEFGLHYSSAHADVITMEIFG